MFISICNQQSMACDLFNDIAACLKLTELVAIGLQELLNQMRLRNKKRLSVEGSEIAYQSYVVR